MATGWVARRARLGGPATEHDLRGLTPLFWTNVALHGTFGLDLDTHLDYGLGAAATAGPHGASGGMPHGVDPPGRGG